MDSEKTILENIEESYDLLFSAEKKVADYILQNLQEVIMMNVSELATASEVSDATVIRMCKHVGYQGYYQMRLMLSRDMGKKAVEPDMQGPIDSVQKLFEHLAHNIISISEKLDITALVQAVDILKQSHTVFVVATGNTAPLAMDLGFRLERFGIRASYTAMTAYFLNHVSLGTKEDSIIIISKSGTSKQIVQALEVAKKIGMKSIAITGTVHSPITKESDVVLLSCCENSIFASSEPDDHLYEMAVCDALLYFLGHGETMCREERESTDAQNDAMELLLSEYKL